MRRRLRSIRRSSWTIAAAIVAIGIVLMQTGAGLALDDKLGALRFGVVDRQASGRVVVVEMDAASAAVIKRWPWSRANYAQVVDNLRRAGAASIVFDVDFSSSSDAAGDAAFAGALTRADGLVALPTFGQAVSDSDRRSIDALPIPMLRPHVALASVSVHPDENGQVRVMPFATMTVGTPRPTLSAYIAGRSGAADEDFPIDMSIVPTSIPRLSFVAVRDGRFDPAAVRGRDILIGATAVEMGDRYGTARWGVIPGVIVQAMAAETLLRGVPVRGVPMLPFLLALAAVAAILTQRTALRIALVGAAALAMLVGAALVAQQVFLVTYPLPTGSLMIAGAIAAALARDILNRFRTQRTIDEATGLPNARALIACRGDGAQVRIALAQIDNYDALHAVLGAEASGDLVKRAAERLALVAHSGLVYRVSDRQLAFLLDHDASPDDTLDGLRMVMLQPIEVAGRRVDMAMSIGIAAGPLASIDPLLVDATLAAERARGEGVFWRRAETDLDDLERSVSLMGELDEAIARGEIDVYYQPKYDVRKGRIGSVEALVRWRHATRGFVGPDVFIPLAERTNRIAPLTLHVVRRVIRDAAAWRGAHDVTAAINISAKLLSNAAFNADVEALLAEALVPTSALIFEVTESAAMSDPAVAVAALQHYRELGVGVSMDDYGTGQSTLTYIRQLPLNELKIDRSFVQHAHRNANDAVLVRSTIDLAHRLGLKVVAEGVEDEPCLAFLRDAGCDMIQGYLISRPVPVDQLTVLLHAERETAASA